MSKHNLTTLPKWAQDKIQRLEADLAWWKAQTRSQTKGTSEVGYDYYGNTYGEAQHLPQGSSVFFRLSPPGDYDNVVFGRITQYGQLEIRGNSPIRIRPLSSNLILVEHEA